MKRNHLILAVSDVQQTRRFLRRPHPKFSDSRKQDIRHVWTTQDGPGVVCKVEAFLARSGQLAEVSSAFPVPTCGGPVIGRCCSLWALGHSPPLSEFSTPHQFFRHPATIRLL